MLSGIGDHSFLQAMGIETLVDLPDVGRHLQDRPIMANYWTVSSNQTLDNVSRDPAIFNADLALWEKNRTGLFAASPTNTIGFIRISKNDPIFQNFTDPSAGTWDVGSKIATVHKYLPGPNTPHIEFLPGVGHSILFLLLPYLIVNLYIGQFQPRPSPFPSYWKLPNYAHNCRHPDIR